MATPSQYLQQHILEHESRRPSVLDQSAWLPRYMFVPFRTRPLSTMKQQSYGLIELTAGVLLPILRFRRTDIDYDEVKRVPTDPDGNFMPTDEGVSTLIQKERAPAIVVDAIFRTFNPHHGTDPQQDNGICEIEALRGVEDLGIIQEIQQHCLPTFYRTAREQLAQLDEARRTEGLVGSVPERPYVLQAVAERLYSATEQAKEWATWSYNQLIAQMEDRDRSGKDRASPFNAAVCEWLELPLPRFQTKLAGLGQAAPPQTIVLETARPIETPQVWCETCGAHSNLGPQGQMPKQCAACGSAFEQQSQANPADQSARRSRTPSRTSNRNLIPDGPDQ